MKRFSGKFLLCTALIYLSAACATSPTGRRQLMLVSEESAIASSKQAYVEMLKSYEQQGKIDNNKESSNENSDTPDQRRSAGRAAKNL